MRHRSFLLVAGFLVLLLAGAGAVYAYDHSRKDTIARGITVGGVRVGGLTARRARLGADLNGTVQEALRRSREGDILTRTFRNLSGARVDAELQPSVVY